MQSWKKSNTVLGKVSFVSVVIGVCGGLSLVFGLAACGGAGGSGRAKEKSHPQGVSRTAHDQMDDDGGQKSADSAPTPRPQKARWEQTLKKGSPPTSVPPPKKAAYVAKLTGACAKYYRCCIDYTKALKKIKNIPKTAIEAAKKGCEKIRNLIKIPYAQESCRKAMEAMKKGAQAMSSMPGFVMPPSCNIKMSP
jgi:hypothetical protein